MKRVSDVVTEEKVRQWKDGEVVTIKAGTGRGKSYFVKNTLYKHAKENNKKILMLIHRANCVDQFQIEIEEAEKTDNIHIRTYQYLESTHRRNGKFDFSDYQYIVCDEFHYFMSDANFNKYTDISLNAILNQENSVKIFMSATGDQMKNYLCKKKKIHTSDHDLGIDFNFIKSLMFYNKDETLESVAEQAIAENRKTIFFVQSAKKAYALYKKYKDVALFNCGKSDFHYKYVNEDKIKQMLKEEKFEELILISTTAMDAGVNLIDDDLHHVVCDVRDIGTLIQCIGRKRLKDNNDYIHLLIKSISNRQLGGIETQLKRKISMADYLMKNTVEEYVERYSRELDYSHIVYDEITEDGRVTKKVNELAYFKCLIDIAEIEVMKSRGDFGYCKYLAEKLGFYDGFNNYYDYSVFEEDVDKMNLEEYLNSVVGKKLLKDEQKELIENIDLRINGRQQKSYKKLNEGLEMINLPYIIIPKKSGSVRFWKVEKIEE